MACSQGSCSSPATGIRVPGYLQAAEARACSPGMAWHAESELEWPLHDTTRTRTGQLQMVTPRHAGYRERTATRCTMRVGPAGKAKKIQKSACVGPPGRAIAQGPVHSVAWRGMACTCFGLQVGGVMSVAAPAGRARSGRSYVSHMYMWVGMLRERWRSQGATGASQTSCQSKSGYCLGLIETKWGGGGCS